MKRLILVRHATAVDTGPEGSDFHRRLKKRGRREALLMAERVEAVVGVPDLLLSSPADRALETAKVFIARLGIPADRLQLREHLYGGLLPEEFLLVVQGLSDRASTVMVFGHDPSFTEFASFLIPGFRAAIPKAGVLVVDIERAKWRSVRAGDGRAGLFARPPEPDVQKRMEEDVLDRLVIAIRGAVYAALREVGIVETQEVVKVVARASARMARELRPFAKAAAERTPPAVKPAGPRRATGGRKTVKVRARSVGRGRP